MKRFGGTNRRLAVDKIEVPGLRALDAAGIDVCNGMYPEDFIPGAFDYVLEPGMTLCVEAYFGAVGAQGVKLEEQVLITDPGYENLTKCPFDPKLV